MKTQSPEKILQIDPQEDFLRRVTSVRSPLDALIELVWNSLDADATVIEVVFRESSMGLLTKIFVTDNGHGFSFDTAERVFSKLGGSPKVDQISSPRGRHLHGRGGKGRLKALGLGSLVTWTSTVENKDGSLSSCRVEGSIKDLSEYRLFRLKEPLSQEPGVTVEISGFTREPRSLRQKRALESLSIRLAPHLMRHGEVEISYDGRRVRVEQLMKSREQFPIEVHLEGGSSKAAILDLVEWKEEFEREICACDDQGIALEIFPAHIRAPGEHFSAYLKSNWFRELSSRNELMDLHHEFGQMLDSARDRLATHFRDKRRKAKQERLREWKASGVYPYKREPSNEIGRAERELFEVVAITVNEKLKDFEEYNNNTKAFVFRLLRIGLENEGNDLYEVLQEVLSLNKSEIKDLQDLLERTTLSNIIKTSKRVADRLEFLSGLSELIENHSKTTKERRHLQKLLEVEPWIFGERFALAAGDESLDNVLEKHLKIVGRKRKKSGRKVVRTDGRQGIVDFLVSRSVPQPDPHQREHLIVEIKGPSVPIDYKAVRQIQSYARAVVKDERFDMDSTTWHFWAVSSRLSEDVMDLARQKDRPKGLVLDSESPAYSVWVKTWGELIDDNTARLRLFQEKLQYEHSHSSGLEYLKRTHEKFIPPSV